MGTEAERKHGNTEPLSRGSMTHKSHVSQIPREQKPFVSGSYKVENVHREESPFA